MLVEGVTFDVVLLQEILDSLHFEEPVDKITNITVLVTPLATSTDLHFGCGLGEEKREEEYNYM